MSNDSGLRRQLTAPDSDPLLVLGLWVYAFSKLQPSRRRPVGDGADAIGVAGHL